MEGIRMEDVWKFNKGGKCFVAEQLLNSILQLGQLWLLLMWKIITDQQYWIDIEISRILTSYSLDKDNNDDYKGNIYTICEIDSVRTGSPQMKLSSHEFEQMKLLLSKRDRKYVTLCINN